jgi:hypothetical protein
MLRFDPRKPALAAEEFFQTDGILWKSREDFLMFPCFKPCSMCPVVAGEVRSRSYAKKIS